MYFIYVARLIVAWPLDNQTNCVELSEFFESSSQYTNNALGEFLDLLNLKLVDDVTAKCSRKPLWRRNRV